jgi:Concanavalin A-like lectin/glucanases superfamily
MKWNLRISRISTWFVLAGSLALAACGGGGSATTANENLTASSSSAAAYTGPAPSTPDVQAFELNLWQNIRGQNRCGACHNATTPAQMPNFARSDDVNLAYAQANTVVNLSQPSTSEMVVKVSGGHNCWLADPSACGQILTTWISNWASATGATSATQVQLVAPPDVTVGQSLNFPASYVDYETTIYNNVTVKYCSGCHSPAAATPQSPYFAAPVSQIANAYQAAIPKIDFTGCVPFSASCGTNSRFYQRLAVDMHNCWDNCANDAAYMLTQIQAFAQMLTPTNVDPSLVISKALTLTQGTIASGASRYDADTIAKYEFQTGTGLIAYDTSGVDPAADMTITGNVTWAGGWGVNVGAGGKMQATTGSSSKIFNLIQATGEFSVEAWVAPALVAVPDNSAFMVSYSGGDTARNFTLAQTNQNYDFMLRTSTSSLDGIPELATPTAAQLLQASLQHVVLTYDPINGRQIYVNGVNAGVTDPEKGGTIANWDSTFALVLGNETSGDKSWQGEIKFVAIHSRSMTAAQVLQNYNAGVGERYYLLFDVSSVINVPQTYLMMTVSQYDSYSYLFYQPTFISLNASYSPTTPIPIAGISIGLNGQIPQVGQAYLTLNTTVNSTSYTSQGQVLSSVGTVIALQSGPLTDQFFLTFNQLGSATHVTVPATVVPQPILPGATVADIGVRTFAEINSTLSVLTGVPTTDTAVTATYQAVQQQLPAVSTLESFSSANQVGVAQLAIQYCNEAVNSPTYSAALFPGVTFSGSTYPASTSTVSSALAAKVLGNGQLASMPAASTVTTELNNLIGALCSTTACNNTARAQAVTAAACAAAFGSADMLIK